MSIKSFFGKLFRKVEEFNPQAMIQQASEWASFDWDNTIIDWSLGEFGELKCYKMADGKVLTSRDVLERLRKKYKLICYSCRFNEEQPEVQRAAAIAGVKAQMKQYGIPCDAIWAGRGKPVCAVYWDDNAFRADDNGTEAMLNSLK